MNLTIPTYVAALLPIAATALSSWFNDNQQKPGTNALIALVAILITAVACEWLAGGLIPNNPAATFLGVLGYVTILMQGDLGVLYSYLVAKPSPAIKHATPVFPAVPRTNVQTNLPVTSAPPAPVAAQPPILPPSA